MHPIKSTLAILSIVALLSAAGCHRHAMGEGTTVTRNGFTVEIEDGRMVLSDSIHFEFDSDVLAPESHDFLDLIAEVVESHSGIGSIRIEGHTDRLGTPEHNQDLSERRARVVADYLRSKGVQQPLTTVGFGFTRPVCTEETEACDARNRRVEFLLAQD